MKFVLSGRMPVTFGASISRANFFAGLLFWGALLSMEIVAQSAHAGEVALTDQFLTVAFDTHSGVLTRLKDNTANWNIERRPQLGDSFRLFAPLPERRWNPVFGEKQRAAKVRRISDHEIQFRWTNLVSESGGVLPLALTADVTLTNGTLTFNATLENDSALTVETIDYPYFGDFNPPSRKAANNMEVWTMSQGNLDDLIANEIYPHFHNEKGYWGVFWPTKNLEADRSPFCLIQAMDQGVYVGISTAELPYRMQYTFEQHPGVMSAVTSLVPPGDEIGGQPVHLEFRICHFVFEKPHSTVKLAPVVLRCYHGDQHAGSDIYKQLRSNP